MTRKHLVERTRGEKARIVRLLHEGEHLTDAELGVAGSMYQRTAEDLAAMGPEFGLALAECRRMLLKIQDMEYAREYARRPGHAG